MLRVAKIITISLLLSSVAFADDDDWDEPGYYQPRYEYYPRCREEIVYVPERVVEYVQPQPQYYAPSPPPRYYGYDQRSPQGLVGGLVGSMMGYQLGGGDPLAAGIGAAAGAWIGNGMY